MAVDKYCPLQHMAQIYGEKFVYLRFKPECAAKPALPVCESDNKPTTYNHITL